MASNFAYNNTRIDEYERPKLNVLGEDLEGGTLG